jgi:hypothetical protein
MSAGITKTINNMVAHDSPWQFKLLAIMVIMFFIGGLLLDAWASALPFPKEVGLSKELDELSVDFLKAKHAALTKSATLLYDLAKIALGALIATITQSLRSAPRLKNKKEKKPEVNA